MSSKKLPTSPYILVFWEEEERYSVVKRDQIEDSLEKTLSDYYLNGISTSIKWNSEQSFMAKIINTGEKSDLNKELKKYRKEAKELKKSLEREEEVGNQSSQGPLNNSEVLDLENTESQSSTPRKRKRASKSATTKKQKVERNSLQIHNILNELDPNLTERDSESSAILPNSATVTSDEGDVEYWIKQHEEEQQRAESFKVMYEKQKERADTYKNKVKTLRKSNKKLREETNNPDFIELGGGVSISREKLDTIKTVSCDASKFARNLFRLVFSPEEIIGKSLFGQRCRANQNSITRPSVDAVKRDAVILTTLKEFSSLDRNGQPFQRDPIRRIIHQSLGAYLREKTTESKKKYP